MSDTIESSVDEPPKLHIIESPQQLLPDSQQVSYANVYESPPSYDLLEPQHQCALINEGWPAQRKSKKTWYIMVLIPLPIPSIINLVALVLFLNDSSDPDDKDAYRIAIYIDAFLEVIMILAVILGIMAVVIKKPGLFLTVSALLGALAGVYIYVAFSSIVMGNILGIAIAAAMIFWFFTLIYMTRGIHLARLRLCKECY